MTLLSPIIVVWLLRKLALVKKPLTFQKQWCLKRKCLTCWLYSQPMLEGILPLSHSFLSHLLLLHLNPLLQKLLKRREKRESRMKAPKREKFLHLLNSPPPRSPKLQGHNERKPLLLGWARALRGSSALKLPSGNQLSCSAWEILLPFRVT